MILIFRISKCQAIVVPDTKNPMHSSVKSQERTPSHSQTKPSQDSTTTTSVDNNVEEKVNDSNNCSLKESSQHVPLYAVPEKLKSKVIINLR